MNRSVYNCTVHLNIIGVEHEDTLRLYNIHFIQFNKRHMLIQRRLWIQNKVPSCERLVVLHCKVYVNCGRDWLFNSVCGENRIYPLNISLSGSHLFRFEGIL